MELVSDFTRFNEILPQIDSLSQILDRVYEEDDIPLDLVAKTISSEHFLSRNPRNVMDDIVAQYSNIFGSKSLPGKKKKPVVFLPNSPKNGKDCEPSGRMSSFAYLAFVLSMINAVVNAANNVNNNQVHLKG